MYKLIVLIAAFGLFASSARTAELQGNMAPKLGEPISEHEAEQGSFTILPDGTGLPKGKATAVEGKEVYDRWCLACHGINGQNGINDRLVGGHGTLTSQQPIRTVGSYWPYSTTVFDFIRRAMPYQAPGTLTNDEIYAVTAYLLFLNNIVREDKEINEGNLHTIKMPSVDKIAL